MSEAYPLTSHDEVIQLTEQILVAVADYVTDKTDTHGFSRLDSFIALIEERPPQVMEQLDHALSSIIRSMPHSERDTWVAIFLIIQAAGFELDETSLSIIKRLDKSSDPFDPQARYHAYRAYIGAGGKLTKPQLDKEKRLKEKLPAQWLDLVLWAFRGSPDSAIRVIKELLGDVSSGFTWKDVSQRLQYYYTWFGPEDFNRGMRRIIVAVPEPEGRSELANEIKKLYDVDVLPPPSEEVDSVEAFSEETRFRVEQVAIQAVYRLFATHPATSGFAEAAKDLVPLRPVPTPRPGRSSGRPPRMIQ